MLIEWRNNILFTIEHTIYSAKVIEAVDSGSKPRKDIAQEFKISMNTLSTILKNKSEIVMQPSAANVSRKRKRVCDSEVQSRPSSQLNARSSEEGTKQKPNYDEMSIEELWSIAQKRLNLGNMTFQEYVDIDKDLATCASTPDCDGSANEAGCLRKFRYLTISGKAKVIDVVRAGGTTRAGIAKEFQISISTLQYIVKNEDRILAELSDGNVSHRKRKCFNTHIGFDVARHNSTTSGAGKGTHTE